MTARPRPFKATHCYADNRLNPKTLVAMRHHSLWTTLACWAVACLLWLPAAARAGDAHAELYRSVGLDAHFATLWRQIDDTYRALPKAGAGTRADIDSARFQQRFGPEALREHVLAGWREQLSGDDITVAALWHESALGHTLSQRELEAVELKPATLTVFLRELRDAPPPASRLTLLRRLDQAVGASAAATDLGGHIELAAVAARQANGQAPAAAPTPAQVAETQRRDRNFIQALLRQEVLRTNLYIYRDADEADLLAYLAFAESPAGARFYRSTLRALGEAIEAGSAELQASLSGQNQQASR